MALRIIFMGTPDFSVPALDAIAAAGHEIIAVYSQPPRQAGRGMAERKSAVHQRAEERGIPVFTPVNFKDSAAVETFANHRADVAVVVAYGLLLPDAVLNAPRLGCFNVHASRLPRWRGAAPIQRAIMAGDISTAVAVMRMERGLDTGPVCGEREIEITQATTAGMLHDALAAAGASLMVEVLGALEAGTMVERPQAENGVTYARKIDKGETEIDFTMSAPEVIAHIHGLSPFPGAWFQVQVGDRSERIKVLAAELADMAAGDRLRAGRVLEGPLTIGCGRGAVRLVSVQRAGKKPVDADDFQRGFTVPVGTQIRRTSSN